MFISTKSESYGENRKANIKNHNLPILNYMYTGDASTHMSCSIFNTPAFLEFNDIITGATKRRFRIDFNHIRQFSSNKRQAGVSLDKDKTYGPSDLFRGKRLDDRANAKYLFEFMTIMPVSTEAHSYISQDSAMGHITLKNFNKSTWPWVLKSKKNYDQFCKKYDITGIEYNEFIDHLSNIQYDSIHDRLQCNTTIIKENAFINTFRYTYSLK